MYASCSKINNWSLSLPLKKIFRDSAHSYIKEKDYYLETIQAESYLGRRQNKVIVNDYFRSHNI